MSRYKLLITAILNLAILIFAGLMAGSAMSKPSGDEDTSPMLTPPNHEVYFPFILKQLVLSSPFPTPQRDALQEYAQACDQAIGVTVSDFSCDAGTLVETTNPTNPVDPRSGNCDRPNRLNGECDPGSRFQVLTNSSDAYVVAHCRKKGGAAGKYGDIAVIQHNWKTGATCFYQSPVTHIGTLDGNVKAPSKGMSAWPWKSPANTAGDSCGGCHDNGPLIRSPYITQPMGSNTIPGAGDPTFNKDQPYYFIGKDFASWKVYKVEVYDAQGQPNKCITCHRMGTNNLPGELGTALDFGIRATGPDGTEPHKNPHSPDSPIWMPPGQITYSKENEDAAKAIRDCALRRNENPLPNSPSCKITPLTGASTPSVPGSFTAVWRPSTEGEIQVYGWTYEDYRKKYDELWPLGWRLKILQPYVVNGQVLYNAVWYPSTEGEIQVYGWTYEDYRKRYDELWPLGWRLKILQPFVVNGQVLYSAVWNPSTEGEIQVYGWTYEDYRKRYDELWPQGWRLKILQPFVVNGQVLYSAVWHPSTEGEIQVYGWTYEDYRKKYDELWPQGWRLKILQAH